MTAVEKRGWATRMTDHRIIPTYVDASTRPQVSEAGPGEHAAEEV